MKAKQEQLAESILEHFGANGKSEWRQADLEAVSSLITKHFSSPSEKGIEEIAEKYLQQWQALTLPATEVLDSDFQMLKEHIVLAIFADRQSRDEKWRKCAEEFSRWIGRTHYRCNAGECQLCKALTTYTNLLKEEA